MKLYGFWRSSATWRVRIVLHLKEIAVQYVAVNLAESEHLEAKFREVSPLGQVPALELPDGLRLTQSLAIIDYLESIKPKPSIYPVEPWARAQALEIAELINAGTQPLQNSGVARHLKDALQLDPTAWRDHWVGRGMATLESVVSKSAGRFAVGDTLSVADACIVPQLYFCRRFEISVDHCPTLLAIDKACSELDAFRAAHANAQPDAPN